MEAMKYGGSSGGGKHKGKPSHPRLVVIMGLRAHVKVNGCSRHEQGRSKGEGVENTRRADIWVVTPPEELITI